MRCKPLQPCHAGRGHRQDSKDEGLQKRVPKFSTPATQDSQGLPRPGRRYAFLFPQSERDGARLSSSIDPSAQPRGHLHLVVVTLLTTYTQAGPRRLPEAENATEGVKK